MDPSCIAGSSGLSQGFASATDMSKVLVDGTVRLLCKVSTCHKVLLLLERFLQPGEGMSPAQAVSLYGKCQWVLLHGQIGCSALSAIKERQYQPSAMTGSDLVSERIRDSLVLLQHLATEWCPTGHRV